MYLIQGKIICLKIQYHFVNNYQGGANMDMKIVFCGGGAMAEGILGGILDNGVVAPENVTMNELLEPRCKYLNEKYKVNAVPEATEEIRAADLVIIAVNPFQVPTVTKTIRPLVNGNTIILSIAAGITLGALSDQLGSDKKILRVMPNTLIKSGNGYSAVCVNENIDDDDKNVITTVVNALGQTMYIKEDMFDTFTGFCCTGPVWLYKTAEALIDAGVYAGFSRTESRNMVIKNMLGTAQVLDETGVHPAMKVDEMTSPSGVGIEALQTLQQERFAGALLTSVDAAVKKANSMK